MVRLLNVSIILADAIFDTCQMWCVAFLSELHCVMVPTVHFSLVIAFPPFILHVLSSKSGVSGRGLSLVSGL